MKTRFLVKTVTFLTAFTMIVSCNNPVDGLKNLSDSKKALPEGVRTGYYMGEEIHYSVVDGENIFQQDILIADKELSTVRGAGMTNKRWPNNTVYYSIDSAFPTNRRYIITDAIAHWTSNTGIKFVNSSSAGNRIVFKRHATSSNSYLGMIGGAQTLNLADWASTGTAIHEIGHALGVFHEQSRTDRDDSIIIKWDNIYDNMEHNFKTFTASGYSGFNWGEFDFDSIMMYPAYTGDTRFAIDTSKPIITKKDGSTFSVQRSKLSVGDIHTITQMYPELSKIVMPSSAEYQKYMKADSGVNIIPGDFNGDGKTDFIKQEKGDWAKDDLYTFKVFFSLGNGDFNIVTPAGRAYQVDLKGDGANIIPGDFNGDGKTDFIRQEKGANDDDDIYTFNVYFSKGDGYFNIVTPNEDQYQKYCKGDNGVNIIPGDFNGDGKTDFIKQEKGDWAKDNLYTFQVFFSRGNGYFDSVTPEGDAYQIYCKADDGANLIPGDFNGDGKTDFIKQEKGAWASDDLYTFQVFTSRGDGYFDRYTPAGNQYQIDLKDEHSSIIPGDFNKDGKTDFIMQEKGARAADSKYTFKIYYSNGNGTFNTYTPVANIYQHDLRGDAGVNIIAGDYNGDGKADFIRQEKGSWDNDDINTFMIYFTK